MHECPSFILHDMKCLVPVFPTSWDHSVTMHAVVHSLPLSEHVAPQPTVAQNPRKLFVIGIRRSLPKARCVILIPMGACRRLCSL